MAAPTLGQWDYAFLKDIGAPINQANVNFLDAWAAREGGMQTKGYNPLYTTERMPGSQNVGADLGGGQFVQAYPTLAEGAQADANAMMNGLYNNLLGGLRSGNPLGSNYASEMHTWSGGGYSGISGVQPYDPSSTFGPFMGGGGNASTSGTPLSGGNPPPGLSGQALQNFFQNQATGKQATKDAYLTQIAEAQLQQWIADQSKYANTEAGYQQQNLLLSEADLQSQQAALVRERTLAGREQGITEQQYALQNKEYGQQFRDMLRNYITNKEQTWGQQAGAGNYFTRGGRDQRTNLQQDYLSSRDMLKMQQRSFLLGKRGEELNYAEQVAKMQDEKMRLHRMAQRYGISEEEIKTRLAQQLSNIRYGGLTSLYPLEQQIGQDQLIADLSSIFAQPIVPTGTAPDQGPTTPASAPAGHGAGYQQPH